MSDSSPTQRIKRLVIMSDGSWAHPEKKTYTNIISIAQNLKHESSEQIQQVIRYDPGVGTSGSGLDRLEGGAVGAGIDLNITELYTFLALNYDPGDEIYLFGYSRGAYTVRSLAGMMHETGLLKRSEITCVDEAYELYREDASEEKLKAFREKHGERVPIKLLGCFDTVGSLGLPWESPPLLPDWNRSYRFHNTFLSDMIENAIHIMSIDEDRHAFRPTRMNAAEGVPNQLTQLFVPGGHGIGGGSDDESEAILAKNALTVFIKAIRERTALEFENSIEDILGYKADVPVVDKGLGYGALKFLTGSHVREMEISELHWLTAQRYQEVPTWRPKALEKHGEKLLAADVAALRKSSGD